MTFTDEVLRKVWQVRIEWEAEVLDRLGLDSAAECAEANAAGLAAMRAVLEGHPQDKHGPDPDRMQAVLRDISDLLADAGVPGGTTLAGGVIWLRERAEQARDLATAHLIAVLAELEQDFTEAHDLTQRRERECASDRDYSTAARLQAERIGYAYAALRVKRELDRLRLASDGSQR